MGGLTGSRRPTPPPTPPAHLPLGGPIFISPPCHFTAERTIAPAGTDLVAVGSLPGLSQKERWRPAWLGAPAASYLKAALIRTIGGRIPLRVRSGKVSRSP